MASKIDGRCISATQQNANAFAWLRFVTSRKQCRKSSGASGFRDDPQHFPERFLRLLNGGVRDELHAMHMAPGDGKHQFANAFRSERVGPDSAGRAVNGMAGI